MPANKRPLAVTIIGWLYIATGALGFLFHLTDFNLRSGIPYDLVEVEIVRLIAILSGAYLLRGKNWARWLALAWIGFHVVIGALHSAFQFALHAVFCAAIAYFLFSPPAKRYFHSERASR